MSLIPISFPLSLFFLYHVEELVYIFLLRFHMHRGISLEILQSRLARSVRRGRVTCVYAFYLCSFSSFRINYHPSLFSSLFPKDVLTAYFARIGHTLKYLFFSSIPLSLFPLPLCRKLLTTRSTGTADLI